MTQCHAMLCTEQAVGILEVKFTLKGKVFTYDYPYCAQDLPFFKAKYEAYDKYIVSERPLDSADDV